MFRVQVERGYLFCEPAHSISSLFCCMFFLFNLHVLGFGDFKQLPPVPNYLLQDDGSYCLESEFFEKIFKHHINLTKVHSIFDLILIFGVLTPLSTIFQLYHGDQF